MSQDVIEHVERLVGPSQPLGLGGVISLHVVPAAPGRPCTTLFTTGASGGAELVLRIAPEASALGWPAEWLRRMAERVDPTLPPFLVTNGDPPEPLGPDTELSTWLFLDEGEEWELHRPDGSVRPFYSLFAIYPEERELYVREGVASLLSRLYLKKVPAMLNPTRLNVGA